MRRLLGAAVILASLAAGLAALSPSTLYVDEEPHLRIMLRFARGVYEIHETLPMWPTWHVVGMALLRVTGIRDVEAALLMMRLASMGCAVVAIAAFHGAAREVDPEDADVRTLQLALCPLVFPYHVLVFTDTPSLAFVMVGLLLSLRRRYDAAGLVMAGAVLLRQTNLIWLALFTAMAWHREYGLTWTPAAARTFRVPLAVMAAVGAVALAAGGLVWNAGALATNPPGFYLGNPFMMWLYFGALFLPVMAAHLDRLARLLARPPVLLLVASAAALFVVGFNPGSPFNVPGGYTTNEILHYFWSDAPRRAALFLLMALPAVALLAVPLKRPAAWLWYPFSVLSMAPIWGIGPRYYIVPLALFLLFRGRESRAVEWVLVGLYAVGTLAVMHMLVTACSFPG